MRLIERIKNIPIISKIFGCGDTCTDPSYLESKARLAKLYRDKRVKRMKRNWYEFLTGLCGFFFIISALSFFHCLIHAPVYAVVFAITSPLLLWLATLSVCESIKYW